MSSNKFFIASRKSTSNDNSTKRQCTKSSNQTIEPYTEQTSDSNQAQSKHEKQSKKTFDKKSWRLQKYSHRHKMEKWQSMRKMHADRQYSALLRSMSEPKFDVNRIYEQVEQRESSSTHQPDVDGSVCVPPMGAHVKKKRPKEKPHEQYKRIQTEREQLKQQIAEKKLERNAALKAFKQDRLKRFKALNRKTSKGQPIMNTRIEYLYEKIKKSFGDS